MSTDAGRIYIAIAGNIGAGKSTLVDFLCRTYGVPPFFEPGVDGNSDEGGDNPYLADFYADMKAWGFHSQVYFLTHKFRIHQELDKTPGIVVQDRTIYEDAEVFATALYKSGKMSERDWKTYSELYETICNSIKPPDLTVYLKCSLRTTKQRIKLRGRAMEQSIPTSYLKLLQDSYDRWFARWTKSEVLVLDTDRLDYISDLVDRLDVLDRIERYLPRRAIDPRALRQARHDGAAPVSSSAGA
ncbi:MAG: deoxynucleoside kinase [Deltaproteobacteria bacterium]|nr:deoxynucleoside kinase [Deltaproteobacteria bacterium]